MPPGWYDDPWSHGPLRWWDGAQWTAHVTYPNYPQFGYLPPASPRDLDRTTRWGRRVSLAVAIGAAITVAQFFLTATVLHDALHQIVHQIDVYNDQLDANPDANPPLSLHLGSIYLFELLALPAFVVQILMIVWLYQSAELAARLRLPASLKPRWAILGFLVPVVSLWFPYLVARDLLPPGDPDREFALRWWLFNLATGFVIVIVLITSFFSLGAALVLALIGSAVPLLGAINARRMIAAVAVSHHRLAGYGAAAPT